MKGINKKMNNENITRLNLTDNKDGTMTFGNAIEAMKEGKRVARRGWNGKNMFIFLTRGSRIDLDEFPAGSQNMISTKITGSVGLDQLVINDHIDMKTANGSITIGWTASQVDMLSDDWFIVK